jgi:hypothetical protein
MHSQDGILYVATGNKYVAEAVASARSAKSQMPQVPIAMASDVGSQSLDFDLALPLSPTHRPLADRIRGMLASPFARTLFLDTDTFVLQPVGHLFNLLDRFDICASFEPAHGFYSIPPVPDGFPELNGGVILFNNTEQVRAILATWLALYEAEAAAKIQAGQAPWHDQLALTRAVYSSGLRFFVLPPEYNCRIIFPQFVSGPVYIAHCRLKDPSSYAGSLAFLNRESGPRMFNPNPGRLPSLVANTVKLFRRLIRESGPRAW